jgi:hypothetical protein
VAGAIAAIASTAVAGGSIGVFVAAATHAHGFRPRRSLREHGRLARRWAAIVAVAATAATIAGVVAERHQQAPLALTCLAVGLLLAVASWVVLVEADDDGADEIPEDPEWWPAFERELADWSRQRRVPAGPRA